MGKGKIERLKEAKCPYCGHIGPPKVAGYIATPNRVVCAECGRTIRTFITPVDFLLVGVVIFVIGAYLLFAP